MKAIIQINNVVKKFKRVTAVDGLALTLPEGAITAFLGPNGAGKTTTIKCLLNLHQPDFGDIQVLGRDSRQLGPAEFQKIGYVSENQEIPQWMTVRQLMDYCAPMYPAWDHAFAKKMLRMFDLPLEAKIKTLSRGMKMKTALLSSLAYKPKLVVLDEPFSGLDPLVRDEFIRGLLELTEEEGWSVFISSHDIAEVELLADRVAIIDRGQLKLDETREALQARFRNVEVVLPEGQGTPPQLPKAWLNVETAGRVMRFTESHFDEIRLANDVMQHIPGGHIHKTGPMTLREIFVALARTYRLNGLGQTVKN